MIEYIAFDINQKKIFDIWIEEERINVTNLISGYVKVSAVEWRITNEWPNIYYKEEIIGPEEEIRK